MVLNSFALSPLPHPPLPLNLLSLDPATTKAQLSLGLVGSDGKNGRREVVSIEFQ